jgi:hypothetical protein
MEGVCPDCESPIVTAQSGCFVCGYGLVPSQEHAGVATSRATARSSWRMTVVAVVLLAVATTFAVLWIQDRTALQTAEAELEGLRGMSELSESSQEALADLEQFQAYVLASAELLESPPDLADVAERSITSISSCENVDAGVCSDYETSTFAITGCPTACTVVFREQNIRLVRGRYGWIGGVTLAPDDSTWFCPGTDGAPDVPVGSTTSVLIGHDFQPDAVPISSSSGEPRIWIVVTVDESPGCNSSRIVLEGSVAS